MGFYEQVYRVVREVPLGRVATYGLIAMVAGRPNAARAVGTALARCPFGDVPCHRVVNGEGRCARFFASQPELLQAEGVTVQNGRVELAQYLWRPERNDKV